MSLDGSAERRTQSEIQIPHGIAGPGYRSRRCVHIRACQSYFPYNPKTTQKQVIVASPVRLPSPSGARRADHPWRYHQPSRKLKDGIAHTMESSRWIQPSCSNDLKMKTQHDVDNYGTWLGKGDIGRETQMIGKEMAGSLVR